MKPHLDISVSFRYLIDRTESGLVLPLEPVFSSVLYSGSLHFMLSENDCIWVHEQGSRHLMGFSKATRHLAYIEISDCFYPDVLENPTR